jgi:hypothetical protein
MSAYPKPPREYAIFDPTIFNVSRYLEFPVAQGAQTLQAITVKGLAIFQAYANFQGILVNGVSTFSSYVLFNGETTFNAQSIFNSFIRIKDVANQSTLDQSGNELIIENEVISGTINLKTHNSSGTTTTPLQLSSVSSTFDTDVNFNYNVYIKDGSNNTLIDQSTNVLTVENQVISGTINLQTKNSGGTITTPLQLSSVSSTFSNDVNFNNNVYIKDGSNNTLIDQSTNVLTVENQVISGTINLQTRNSIGTKTTPISITTPLITVNSPTDFIDVINSKNSINIYDIANLSKYSILDQVGNDLVIHNSVNSGYTTFSNNNSVGTLTTPFKVSSDTSIFYNDVVIDGSLSIGNDLDMNSHKITELEQITFTSSYDASGPNKIKLYQNEYGFGVDTNTLKYLTYRNHKFYYNSSDISNGTLQLTIGETDTTVYNDLKISNKYLYFYDVVNNSYVGQEGTYLTTRNDVNSGIIAYQVKDSAGNQANRFEITSGTSYFYNNLEIRHKYLFIYDENSSTSIKYCQIGQDGNNFVLYNKHSGAILFGTINAVGGALATRLQINESESTFYNDLKIDSKMLKFYDGATNNSTLSQEAANLVYRNNNNDGNYYFKSKVGTTMADTMILQSTAGSGSLLYITDVSNNSSYFQNHNNNLVIRQTNNNGTIGFYTSNDVGTAINVLNLSSSASTFYTDITIPVSTTPSSRKIFFSGESDGAFIKYVTTGPDQTYFQIGTEDNSDEPIYFTQSSYIRMKIASDGIYFNKTDIGLATTTNYNLNINNGKLFFSDVVYNNTINKIVLYDDANGRYGFGIGTNYNITYCAGANIGGVQNGNHTFYVGSTSTSNGTEKFRIANTLSSFFTDLEIKNKYLYLYDVNNDNSKYSKIDQENEYFVIRNEATSGQIAFFTKDSVGSSANRLTITYTDSYFSTNINTTDHLYFRNGTNYTYVGQEVSHLVFRNEVSTGGIYLRTKTSGGVVRETVVNSDGLYISGGSLSIFESSSTEFAGLGINNPYNSNGRVSFSGIGGQTYTEVNQFSATRRVRFLIGNIGPTLRADATIIKFRVTFTFYNSTTFGQTKFNIDFFPYRWTQGSKGINQLYNVNNKINGNSNFVYSNATYAPNGRQYYTYDQTFTGITGENGCFYAENEYWTLYFALPDNTYTWSGCVEALDTTDATTWTESVKLVVV